MGNGANIVWIIWLVVRASASFHCCAKLTSVARVLAYSYLLLLGHDLAAPADQAGARGWRQPGLALDVRPAARGGEHVDTQCWRVCNELMIPPHVACNVVLLL